MRHAGTAELMRRIGAFNVLRSALIAKKVGIAPSDLECLDLLHLDGPLTPGEIMAGTGLTSSSVTAMCDRLERRGFIRRERDVHDGRRSLVHIQPGATAHIAALYGDANQRWATLMSKFGDEEIGTIDRFLDAVLRELKALTENDHKQ